MLETSKFFEQFGDGPIKKAIINQKKYIEVWGSL
jgi:hypothetical protein